MGDKEELKLHLDERFDVLEEKLSKFIGRFVTSVAIGVTVFLFIISGAFTFSSRINKELRAYKETNNEKVENISDDLTDIDGALGVEFPNTVPFGERAKRERQRRGGVAE